MMVYVFEFCAAFVIIIVTLYIRQYRRRREHPPGPLGVPFFGMLPFQIFEMFCQDPLKEASDAEKYKEYRQKYGPLWSAEYGKQRIIVLSSWNLIVEAFVDNADLFSGRPTNPAYKIISHGRGIIFTDGEIWRVGRQLAIKSLRDLGMGKRTLENIISNEADDVVSYLEQFCSIPVNPTNAITKGVTNVIMSLVFNERIDYDDTHLETYVNNLRVFAHSDSASRSAGLAPRLFQTKLMKYLYPKVNKFINASEYCYKFIRDKCLDKMNSSGSDFIPKSVLEHFLRSRFNDGTSLTNDEQKEEIIQAMEDLFNAGVDTTSNLLSFCCLMLGKHEDVQRDLRKEVDEVIGADGHISLEARKLCPKILSFIDEVHRFCDVVPKVHHRVMNKSVFHGYKLHPDDIVFADFANLFMDPDLFEDPNRFDAYRFLDKSHMTYCPSKYLIAFGIGKRVCLGESIAVMESFLFLVKIIQRFHISLPEETVNNFKNIIRGHSGIVHAPSDHFLNISLP